MSRYMSTSMSDVATVLTDAPTETVASQLPAISEVAIAAADSSFSVAALQYMIDGVHLYTGLNWWASIALTTLLFRGATVPLIIYEHKNYRKLALALPPVEDIEETLQAADLSAHDKTLSKMMAIYKEFGMTATVLRLIHCFVFIDFYLAVLKLIPSNSYKEKLTVRDAVTVLFCGVLLSTMNFPQALYIHWIASNVFQTRYLYRMHLPGVMKALGIPEKPGRVRKP